MALSPQIRLRRVTVITTDQVDCIKVFLQGAVYCWIATKGEAEFAARNLVGGVNRDWTGTPLRVLFDNHRSLVQQDEEAVKAAGKDLGRILAALLHEDSRNFRTFKTPRVRKYKYVP